MDRSNRYSIEDGKEVWAELENITRYGYSPSGIFQDWLDLMLSSLLSATDNFKRHADFPQRLRENRFDGVYEDRYRELVSKYPENKDRERGRRPIDYFTAAWGRLVEESRRKDTDVLGQLFMDRITHGEHGQFFTPDPITALMTKILAVGDPQAPHTCNDPACGSGRALITWGLEHPGAVLYGTDLDNRCAKMAAINMYIFGFRAVITWGNTLTMEDFKVWHVQSNGIMEEITPEAEPPAPAQVVRPAPVVVSVTEERAPELPLFDRIDEAR